MTVPGIVQPPLIDLDAPKRDVRTQFGALCYRVKDGETQILLITSRNTRRWIMPKGWPMANRTPAEAAAQEAWEEAGVEGKVGETSIGLYTYTKVMAKSDDLPCAVVIFPLRVRDLKNKFPEANERSRRWFSPKKAAKAVWEPELAALLESFDGKAMDKLLRQS